MSILQATLSVNLRASTLSFVAVRVLDDTVASPTDIQTFTTVEYCMVIGTHTKNSYGMQLSRKLLSLMRTEAAASISQSSTICCQ
eukprot:COSAG02_NODE_3082_length_7406_cov_5.254379_3_plen_85_part_00